MTAGSASRRNSGRCDCARSAKSAAASPSGSGSTGRTRSPSTPSGSRLVASTTTDGQRRTTRSARLGRGVQDVLAVVHHEQQGSTVEVLGDRLLDAESVPLLHPERGRHRVTHGRTVGQRGELTQPRSVRELRSGAAGGLDGEPGLADPADPGERDQRALAHGRQNPLDVLVPAEEPGRPPRQVAARPPGLGCGWRRRAGCGAVGVGVEDLLVHLAQRGARVGAQLLDEPAANPLVGGERVGLATAAVLREHELPGQALVERVDAGRGGDLTEELGMPSRGEGRVVAVERGGEPLGLQPGAQIGEPRHVERGERIAPPQAKGPLEQRCRLRRPVGGPRAGDQVPEQVQVHRQRVRRE